MIRQFLLQVKVLDYLLKILDGNLLTNHVEEGLRTDCAAELQNVVMLFGHVVDASSQNFGSVERLHAELTGDASRWRGKISNMRLKSAETFNLFLALAIAYPR